MEMKVIQIIGQLKIHGEKIGEKKDNLESKEDLVNVELILK